MKRILLAAALLTTLLQAKSFAGPEGAWPEESRGEGIPPADWVLVVPAERLPDGQLKIFDRTSDWSRSWTVPKATPEGRRTVALMGDAEDKRGLESRKLDGMDTGALSGILRKYKAPAVAVAVRDEFGGIAVAAWVPGADAAWDFADGGREGVLSTIDRLMAERAITGVVSVSGQRMTDYGMEYRLELSNRGDAENLEMAGTLFVKSVEATEFEGTRAIVSASPGWTLESALKEAGYSISR